MALPEGWKYKTDESGGRVFVGDDPVVITDEGKETPLDFAKVYGSLHAANSESKQRKEKLRELEAQMEAYKGIDPAKYAEYKKAAAKLKQAKDASDGDPAELAAQLAELREERETLAAEKEAAAKRAQELESRNTALTVGQAFKSDPHFTQRNGSAALTSMPPEVAERMLGDYCAPDKDGKVRVYYDTEHKDVVRDGDGQPASFTEGIKRLGPKFSWWEGMQTAKGGSGSGAEAGDGNTIPRGKIKSRADLKTSKDRVAFIKEHGHEAYRELPVS